MDCDFDSSAVAATSFANDVNIFGEIAGCYPVSGKKYILENCLSFDPQNYLRREQDEMEIAVPIVASYCLLVRS